MKFVACKTLWQFRGFILGSVQREYQLRYKGAVLGIAWTILQPLAMIFIYTIIFTQLLKAKLPGITGNFSYSIYLCAGIITWGLFAEIMQRGQAIFLDNANLLKKLRFPRLLLPVIVTVTALINFSIAFVLFLLFLVVSGNIPGIVIFGVFPVLFVQIVFSVSLGVLFGVLNVFFRDVGQISGLVIQFWFWATPIVYPSSILPEWLLFWMNFNPMYHLVVAYQDIFVLQQWPHWQNIAIVGSVSLGVACYALWLFRRCAGEIIDEL